MTAHYHDEQIFQVWCRYRSYDNDDLAIAIARLFLLNRRAKMTYYDYLRFEIIKICG